MPLPTQISKPQDEFKTTSFQIYGLPGSGKSTFANSFENPLFLDCEGGIGHIEGHKYSVQSWTKLRTAVTELKNERHNFKTVIMDTIEWAYASCEKHCCEKLGREYLGQVKDYGNGYGMRNALWRDLCIDLMSLPMVKIFTGHADVKANLSKDEKPRLRPLVNHLAIEPLNGAIGLCMLAEHTYYDFKHKDYPPGLYHILRIKPTMYAETKDRRGKFPEVMRQDFQRFKKFWHEGVPVAKSAETEPAKAPAAIEPCAVESGAE